jgi:RluA family pseudouridine synthase
LRKKSEPPPGGSFYHHHTHYMHDHTSSFKKTSSKHQPKGLTILYEDNHILVVDKADGLLTIGTEKEKLKTAHSLLNDWVKKGNERSKNRVFIVHRLDRETSGLLVFAKNEYAKQFLQENWKEFTKKYYAVVAGTIKEKEGEIRSYLFENAAFKVYPVKDPAKGKLAVTAYKVVKETARYSLVEVTLLTGRKHQIRVHFAEMGHPVAGDKMYGKEEKGVKRLALHSCSLTLIHPETQKEMVFESELPSSLKMMVNL